MLVNPPLKKLDPPPPPDPYAPSPAAPPKYPAPPPPHAVELDHRPPVPKLPLRAESFEFVPPAVCVPPPPG